MISQEAYRRVVEAFSAMFWFTLSKIAPIGLASIGTYTTFHAYIKGKIPLDGATEQMAIVLGISGILHVGGILVNTQAAKLAAAPQPAAQIPNLPATMSNLATNMEKEQTRETGSVKVQK